VEIELYSGRKITASQFVLDRDDDLALILVNNFTSEHYATLGAKPLVGQEVTLVGSPVDEICKFNLTKGHVSALIAKVPDEYDPDKYGVPHFIVDCFGAAGNSGGPVFRGKEIIGLCIWGLDRSGASMSLIADTTHLDAALKACF
jgi:S1-C subfamily serine protease